MGRRSCENFIITWPSSSCCSIINKLVSSEMITAQKEGIMSIKYVNIIENNKKKIVTFLIGNDDVNNLYVIVVVEVHNTCSINKKSHCVFLW